MGEKKAAAIDLIELYFGEAKEKRYSLAPPRLKRWSRGFEKYVGQFGGPQQGMGRQAVKVWKRLIRQNGKMPWELRREDIQQHVGWMEGQGYSIWTVGETVKSLKHFFNWAGENGVDGECGADFNPAGQVRRPMSRLYANAKLLSAGEVEALLEMLRRERTPVGRRDYAFYLACLRLGTPIHRIQDLRWGQVEEGGGAVNGFGNGLNGLGVFGVRWREEGPVRPLPGETAEAIFAYLRASGRLTDQPAAGQPVATDYIFAPLVKTDRIEVGERAEDWNTRRCVSMRVLLFNLKRYGKAAGLAPEKMTLLNLRRTGLRSFINACRDLPPDERLRAIKDFLDSREQRKFKSTRMMALEQAGEDCFACRSGASYNAHNDIACAENTRNDQERRLPNRLPHLFQAGDNRTHGLTGRYQPRAAVEVILEEDIQGVEEQVAGLRKLGRGLLERMGGECTREEAARLGECYILGATRLAEVMKFERRMAQEDKSGTAAERYVEMHNKWAVKHNQPLTDRAELLAAALADEHPGQQAGDLSERILSEEIAATRFILRNTLGLADGASSVSELMRLVEVYSMGCSRLLRLLQADQGTDGVIAAYLKRTLDRAIAEVWKEIEEGKPFPGDDGWVDSKEEPHSDYPDEEDADGEGELEDALEFTDWEPLPRASR